jgi:hypothetical protein
MGCGGLAVVQFRGLFLKLFGPVKQLFPVVGILRCFGATPQHAGRRPDIGRVRRHDGLILNHFPRNVWCEGKFLSRAQEVRAGCPDFHWPMTKGPMTKGEGTCCYENAFQPADAMTRDLWEIYGLPAEPMTNDDIWYGARRLHNTYGDIAALVAEERADTAAKRGALQDYRSWTRIREAVLKLQRTKPAGDESIN